jgi:molybdopterin synthase catalytic subunit
MGSLRFAVSQTAIDTDAMKAGLKAEHAGACVCFEGWVRDHNEGQAVTALEYEAHDEIAVAEGDKVLREAAERFDIVVAHGVHRTGRLEIGDCAVWIGVSAAHRGAAFDACRFIIDEIKQRLPVWKKEHYASGASGWVNCRTTAAGPTR